MSQRRIPFLGWLLLVAVVAALLIAFLGWHVYQSHRFFGHMGTELVRQTEAVARLRELRWELTQAAHHLVLFGGGEDWRLAYEDARRRLEAELDADLGLPAQAPERAHVAGLARLTQSLGAIESQAMAVAQEGRKDEALGLLHSGAYMDDTRLLCAQIDAHAKSVYDRLQRRLQSQREREFVFFTIDVAVLLFAGGLWWQLGLRLRRWRGVADSELRKRITAEVRLRQAQKTEALGDGRPHGA